MADEQTDLYALLGVENEASLEQLTTAYRKASIKVHPDRNPDDPDAAHKFHVLRESFELLKDPKRRQQYDSRFAARRAQAARSEASDAKRRAGLADLREREEQAKRAKVDPRYAAASKSGTTVDQQDKIAALKAQTEKMMRDRMAAKSRPAQAESPKPAPVERTDEPVASLGSVNVRVRYARTQHAAYDDADSPDQPLRKLLEQHCGPLDHFMPAKVKKKASTRLVVFETAFAAERAVQIAGRRPPVPGFEDVEISYLDAPQSAPTAPSPPSFASFEPPAQPQGLPDHLNRGHDAAERQRLRKEAEARLLAEEEAEEAAAL